MDKADAAASFQLVAELRAAGLRAEAYVGNGKIGDQFKYADKRGAAIAVIEGGDERANGEVTLKDLALGAELAKIVESRADWVGDREAQKSVDARRPGGRRSRSCWGGALMAAFPYYDAPAIAALNAQADAHAGAVRGARLCARGAVGAAAGRYFPGPFGRGNPPPHLHADRSVGPRIVPAPRPHHSHLQHAVDDAA